MGSETLVADELTAVPVLVLAAPGVDSDTIAVLSTILERSGADLRGTVQLSDKLAFDGDVDGDLALDLGLTDPDAGALRSAATSSITGALLAAGTPLTKDGTTPTGSESEAPTPTTTTTLANGSTPTCCTAQPPDGDQPTTISALMDRGYLKLSPGPGYDDEDPVLETIGYRYVYLGGPDLDEDQNQVLLSILPSIGPAMPATVISASQPAPEVDQVIVPTVVARVRADEELERRYNTVDNTETFAGLVATVFTLRDMGASDPGQYGQAAGASAVLPPPA